MSTLVAMNPTSPRLVTLTPAPSWDITYSLETLQSGLVHRANSTTRQFAGKGVNVSRALALAGISAPAVVPIARADQAGAINGPGIVPVDVQTDLRTNVTVVESGGRTTKINQAASALSASEWAALRDATAAQVAGGIGTWLLVSGTIPHSDDDLNERLSGLLNTVGLATRIAVDTSGAALHTFARSGRVELIKPNVAELAGCVGRALPTLADVVQAAQEVVLWGVHTVLVSLGAQGFLGVTANDVVWAQSEPVRVVNTIGAGDASVAGFFHAALSGATSLADLVASAAGWGGLKVTQPGSQLMALTPLPRVWIHPEIRGDRPVFSD